MRASDEHISQVLGAMLKAVDRHPDKVYWFVQGLTQIEDVEPNTRHYWSLWQLFADQVKKAKCNSWWRTQNPCSVLKFCSNGKCTVDLRN